MSPFDVRRRRCVIIAMLLFIPSVSQATTVYRLDFDALVKLSERVILATVTKVTTKGEQRPRQIRTIVHLDVKECLFGPCSSSLVIDQLGGRYRFDDGVYTQKVSGAPRFILGERVLLFLERTDTERLVVTGLSQGKFTVLGDNPDAVLTRDLHGLNMMPPKGQFRSRRRSRVTVPTRLDVLRLLLTEIKPIVDVRPTPVHLGGGQQ